MNATVSTLEKPTGWWKAWHDLGTAGVTGTVTEVSSSTACT